VRSKADEMASFPA